MHQIENIPENQCHVAASPCVETRRYACEIAQFEWGEER